MLILEHPRTHSLDEIKPLFDGFILENPQIVAEWMSIEKKVNLDFSSSLDEICDLAYDFIKRNAEVTSTSALVSAFVDFRKIFWNEYVKPTL